MKPKAVNMKYYMVFYFSFSLLFLANFVSSEDPQKSYYNVTAVYDYPSAQVVLFSVRGELSLTCHVNISEDAPDKNLKIEWYKTYDGKEKAVLDTDDRKRVQTVKNDGENGVYKLVLNKATHDDAGNYTCTLLDEDAIVKARGYITASSRPVLKVPPNTSVVEGEKLSIHCIVHGRPSPVISWKVGNETYETSGERVKLQDDKENNIPNAILVIEQVELSDRNEYICLARSNYSTGPPVESKTYVRVKDKLAALWPFLGICAEVFVLCAIILIYEKKRNKTELEESDTDQSPDQKNTPDNGKDSDIRQRK